MIPIICSASLRSFSKTVKKVDNIFTEMNGPHALLVNTYTTHIIVTFHEKSLYSLDIGLHRKLKVTRCPGYL